MELHLLQLIVSREKRTVIRVTVVIFVKKTIQNLLFLHINVHYVQVDICVVEEQQPNSCVSFKISPPENLSVCQGTVAEDTRLVKTVPLVLILDMPK
jgi:hypothetical protein